MLLVEDQPKVRQISVRVLSQLGMMKLEAKDGYEAIEIFRHHKEEICFVLCDLTMPRIMEGARSGMPQAFLEKPYPLARLEDA